jgi:S-adenosylmethionine hydrolase
MVARHSEKLEVFRIENTDYMLPAQSYTFHGRDVFAPAAAYMVKGTTPSELGPPLEKMVPLEYPEPEIFKKNLVGEVVYIDRFGNLMTNLHDDLLKDVDRSKVEVNIGKAAIKGIKKTFGEAKPGESLAYVGSSRFLEIGINGRSAARQWQITTGTRITVQW